MERRRHVFKPLGHFAASRGNGNGGAVGRVDWANWLRLIERKRRLLSRYQTARNLVPREYFAAATFVSFRLDGIEVTEPDVAAALARGVPNKAFRTRRTHRLRNHVSILRKIESAVRLGESLKGQSVIRWYTSISCGLCNANLDDGTMTRLDSIVRRINSPQLRLQPAIIEVARLHAQLIADPFVPSFNGILARLLLRYHLGRCGLPPVLFDPEIDPNILTDESKVLEKILEGVDASYNMLLETQG